MSGAEYVVGINLFVAGLLSAAFLALTLYNPMATAAPWFSFAYSLAMGYFAVLFTLRIFGGDVSGAIFSFAVVLGGMAVFNIALAKAYAVQVPVRLLAISCILSLVICTIIQGMSSSTFWRMFAFQVPYFVMQIIAVGIVYSSRYRRRLDALLLVVLLANAAQFLVKPFLVRLPGGLGTSERVYLATKSALVSQSMTTIFTFAVAALVLAVIIRDTLEHMAEKTETDALTGLLNRTGFERHALPEVEMSHRSGIPMALIVAALDDLEKIQESRGAASAQNVIKAFSDFLKSAAGSHHLVARMDGHEFAILLPSANLITARLFAEGARAAFSSLPINEPNPGQLITVSFGVAELSPYEGLPGLTKRATEALRQAKKDGGDCVRVTKYTIPAVARPIRLG